MKPTLSIVKIGGNIIENEADLAHFLKLFSALKGEKILVHGGGKMATALGEKLGIKTTMVAGRRITDAKSLEVAIMVYAGLLNKKMVASLQAFDCNAIGLTGADAGTIRSVKRPVTEIDFGYVGDVSRVQIKTLSEFLNIGLVPVFCALTHDGSGQLLNTNADTIASELAIGMSSLFSTTLYYCFEKQGVLSDITNDTSVISHINKKRYFSLLKEQVIAAGMLPKLENCFYALDHSVHKVCIGNMQMLRPGHQNFTTLTL
jgi:acetylglutamate kinase